jgi:hypothetical protein
MAGEKSSSTASNAFSLILQALQTAASIGILVVLAMLLIQFKKFSDSDYISYTPGRSYYSPFFVQTV